LVTGASTQALLVQQKPGNASSVMALWAIAWAGTKPLASLADGWLATAFNMRFAGFILIVPAVSLALIEIFLSERLKSWLKKFARKGGRSNFHRASAHP
jgi:asparagine N-glycosylation enzyme membrane subunit Stt3